MINDKIFGEIEYDLDSWYKEIKVKFGNEECLVDLIIHGDEEGEFDQLQYDAYTMAIENWEELIKIEPLLEYYNNLRYELGYEDGSNELYPLIETTEELLEHITLACVVIPYNINKDERRVHFAFSCTWDEDNGMAIRFINEKISEIGEEFLAI